MWLETLLPPFIASVYAGGWAWGINWSIKDNATFRHMSQADHVLVGGLWPLILTIGFVLLVMDTLFNMSTGKHTS